MKNEKINAEDWAEKTLKESPQTDELSEQMKEYMLFGSLLYSQNEKEEIIWLKRVTGDENFEVKPVSVLNGQVLLDNGK